MGDLVVRETGRDQAWLGCQERSDHAGDADALQRQDGESCARERGRGECDAAQRTLTTGSAGKGRSFRSGREAMRWLES